VLTVLPWSVPWDCLPTTQHSPLPTHAALHMGLHLQGPAPHLPRVGHLCQALRCERGRQVGPRVRLLRPHARQHLRVVRHQRQRPHQAGCAGVLWVAGGVG
jgi:hypothetical protein